MAEVSHDNMVTVGFLERLACLRLRHSCILVSAASASASIVDGAKGPLGDD